MNRNKIIKYASMALIGLIVINVVSAVALNEATKSTLSEFDDKEEAKTK